MNELKVENFGPIGKDHVDFGDLTILVGAQASGKSLFLELLKLLEDKEAIVETLRKYNYIISKSNVSYLLEAYFGNGMAGVWGENTKIVYDGREASAVISLMKNKVKEAEEKVFYIPAQGCLAFRMGGLRRFQSLTLRLLMCCASLVRFCVCLCR